METFVAFQPPPRVLMGPGPSNVAASVLEAMARPLVGHLDPAFVKMMEEIEKVSRPKLVAIVHAETSTGAWTPIEEISERAHQAGALVLLDTVTSLGGCPVRIDEWQVDAVYSGTQKCLSCPPGLAPASL